VSLARAQFGHNGALFQPVPAIYLKNKFRDDSTHHIKDRDLILGSLSEEPNEFLAPRAGLELQYFYRKQPFGDKPKLTTE
jgi:hypothetical protein